MNNNGDNTTYSNRDGDSYYHFCRRMTKPPDGYDNDPHYPVNLHIWPALGSLRDPWVSFSSLRKFQKIRVCGKVSPIQIKSSGFIQNH